MTGAAHWAGLAGSASSICRLSPEARGARSACSTLQDRLIRELALAGIDEVEAANRWIREVYLPDHNARFAKPPELPDSAFVPIRDKELLGDILCVQEERIVARDNTVSWPAQAAAAR